MARGAFGGGSSWVQPNNDTTGRRFFVQASVLDAQADLNEEVYSSSVALRQRNVDMMEEQRQFRKWEQASARSEPMIAAEVALRAVTERAKGLVEQRVALEVDLQRRSLAAELEGHRRLIDETEAIRQRHYLDRIRKSGDM
jgi:hypothetical protein